MNNTLLQASPGASIFEVIFIVLIILALFVALRALMLWYWKVDKILENQKETNDLLRLILRKEESKGDDTSKP